MEGRYSMARMGIISPQILSILCRDPWQHRQRTAYEPPPASETKPEPEKKSFWDKVKDRAKEIGDAIFAVTITIITVIGMVVAASLLVNAVKAWVWL
jgi:hypothetical protein